MDITKAEQIALDDALVAPANRLKIGKCNLRLSSDLTSKEATLQVVYDVLKLTPFYKAFQASADVPEIYMQEFWATASVHNRLIRFKMNNKKHIVNLDLEHSREIRKITDVNVNKLHQPWRSFATVINKCLSGKSSYDSLCLSQAQIIWGMYHKKNVDYAFLLWEDFIYQVENKNTKKVNVMHEDTQLYSAILPKELKNEDIQNSESYKEYYVIALGKVPLKTKASIHKKKVDSDTTPKEKPSTDPKDKRVKQTGKMTGSGKSRIQTHNSQASSLGDGVDILSKVPDEQVHEKTGTDEGAGDKPEVPDVPEHHSNSEEESWTFSDGDDDDDDDDATESDDDGDNITHPKLSTFSTDDQEEQDDEEEQEEDDEDEEEISDQLVRTPSDYQTSDESEKQKDDDRVKNGEEDKEGDVTNVALEGGDVDMTEADTTEDTEDAHVTLTAATPVVQQQSSSVSDLVSKFISPTTDEGIDSILNPRTESTTLVNVPISVATETPATTTTIPPPLFPVTQSSQQTPVTTTTTTYPSTTPPPIPNFASLFGFNQRVTALESDLSKLKQSNPFAEAISSIPGIVNEYLGSKMKEAVDVAIQLKSNKLREEAQAKNQEFLNSLNYNIQKLIKDQVKTQTSKIKSKVEKYVTESLGAEVLIHSTNQPQTSYRIASSLLEFELKRILMDKMEENKSNYRSNVQKNLYNALVEAYNTDKDLLSSYGDVLIIPRIRDDKDKDEEPSAGSNQGTKRRDDDVIPAREVHDERQWHSPTSPTPNCKQSSFDEFMATPIDFSTFMINRLKIDHLTQELLTGPTYDLIKGEFKRLHRQYIEDMLLLLVQGKLTNLSLDDRYAQNVALRMYTRRIVIQERVEDLQLAIESYQKKINLTRPDIT
ncbi:hypothetical protein Tco_0494200 [Tanacetum coccineum]